MPVARILIVVPLKDSYPWKAGQPPAAQALEEAAADGIRWLDCVDGPATATVSIEEVPRVAAPWYRRLFRRRSR